MQSPTVVPDLIEENEEYMALRNEDRVWVKTEIADAISTLKPHGWQKAIFVLRQLGPIATIIGAQVALVALTCGALYQSFSHVRDEAEFRTHTKDTLDQIQVTLRSLQALQSPKKVLQEIAALDSKQFVQNLPALRKVSEQPVASAVPNVSALQAVAVKLRGVDENTPEYWPTVLQFIKFASEGISPNVPPPGGPTIDLQRLAALGGALGPFKNETVRLDGVTLDGQIFENSRVIFTENPTRMQNVTFINCVFEMPETENPNQYLKQASKQLLASNLKSVTIKSL